MKKKTSNEKVGNIFRTTQFVKKFKKKLRNSLVLNNKSAIFSTQMFGTQTHTSSVNLAKDFHHHV